LRSWWKRALRFVEQTLKRTFNAELVSDLLLLLEMLNVSEIGLNNGIIGAQFEHRVLRIVAVVGCEREYRAWKTAGSLPAYAWN
jgi:hypothetical protein